MPLRNSTPTCPRSFFHHFYNRPVCSKLRPSTLVLEGYRWIPNQRFYFSSTPGPSTHPPIIEKAKKRKTIFLPSTNFESHVKSHDRSSLDSQLANLGKFQDLYEWQLNSEERKHLPIFRLLDGPPYSNGNPHVGHAVNKVLKDFIVKSRIQLGYRVQYQPGWDCHGLPIELKIAKEAKATTPLEVRQNARHVALTSQAVQMNHFKKWAVAADWTNPYLTMSADYVADQLDIFAKLYEKGIIYRAFMPVYWSPSSKTALAESELEYNENHESTAAFFRYQIINLSLDDLGLAHLNPLESQHPVHLFAMIWTTTPWTLPMNNAIAYSEKLKYAVIEFEDIKRTRELYLIADDLVQNIEKETNRSLIVHTTVDAKILNDRYYRNPMYNELAQPFLPAGYVQGNVGTGLVHTSYAHGHDDYSLAMSRDERVECFVNENGRYTRHMGHLLENKDVLTEGTQSVLEMFKKHFIHSYKHVHSYPYDWRTKKPVIIRASRQWFMDVKEIGEKAVEMLRNQIKVGNKASDQNQLNAMIPLILNRPAWCISRQRVWGVPIPYLFSQSTQKTVISTRFIQRVAEMIRSSNTSDVWWSSEISEILTDHLKQELKLGETDLAELEKGNDIMDVWMDSGVAWMRSYNEDGNYEPADVVIEGLDQFRGWFLSLLLTSVAVNSRSPYKRILVHGFCVDEDEQKMSKSIGNVIDPDQITDGTLKQKALGSDGLRLWVALYGSEAVSNIRIGKSVLEDIDKKLVNIRLTLKFLVGALNGWNGEAPKKLSTLDQFIISATKRYLKRCEQCYEEYRFRSVINEFIQFLQNPLSVSYIHLVKDRLYCNPLQSDSHQSARYTIALVSRSLVDLISTILPHIAVDFYSHHPILKTDPQFAVRRSLTDIYQDIEDAQVKFTLTADELDQIMDLVVVIRSKVAELVTMDSEKEKNVSRKSVQITASSNDIASLRKVHDQENSYFSDLVELLGVSYVNLMESTDLSDELKVELVPSPRIFCLRCRKHNRQPETRLCERCAEAQLTVVEETI